MNVIKKRRSIRAYKRKSLSKKTLQALLEAARYAPSARNLQQLDYKVVLNREMIRTISDKIVMKLKAEEPQIQLSARSQANLFYDAPSLVIITGPKGSTWTDVDAALAAQNLMLCATSLDLGTCFIGWAIRIDNDRELSRQLHIPVDHKVAAAVICGYPDEEPAEKERRLRAEFFR